MQITLTSLFKYNSNSYEIMKRLNRLDEDGCKEIFIRRGEYISIKKIKYILFNYSKQGYSLKEIEYLIRNCSI